jgi:hypothetical protein
MAERKDFGEEVRAKQERVTCKAGWTSLSSHQRCDGADVLLQGTRVSDSTSNTAICFVHLPCLARSVVVPPPLSLCDDPALHHEAIMFLMQGLTENCDAGVRVSWVS